MDISDLTWFQELNIVYLIKQKRIATEVIKIRADYTFTMNVEAVAQQTRIKSLSGSITHPTGNSGSQLVGVLPHSG
jgi:hypothetical protein